MKRQRGIALLTGLVLSLLAGLLAASALRDALVQAYMAGQLRASAQALEQAEAVLLEGRARLLLAPPGPCQRCRPPADAHDVQGGEPGWQSAEQGFFLLQNLGESTLVAHLPDGARARLYRVTAVSRQQQARHVLEAVYALQPGPNAPLRRILWRQRLREP
ncbi:hypothetical protein WCE02_09620 [Pseudomonas juntendi]|uniref:Type IV pilus assembly protein PilX n=1 Tax=Pseudomonas putida TaxID=303 RepID=A0A1X0ZUV3_PSEPU|nr:hypothetical protein [Pseudomonas putida]MEB3901865.1 hypothetical protein [Pseudomonas putida]ORL63494.1 hypothetical protein B7H17_14330 [Pseudomonas putida]